MPDLDAILSLLPNAGAFTSRLLLVDDDESILYPLKLVLESNGFEVTTACNVNEALRNIARQAFDVLVSDLHMPSQGDGLTVVSAMRHANPKAITLIFSSFPEMDLAAAAIVRQADEVIVKPLGVQNLINAIHDRLRRGPSATSRAVESVADILERSTQSTIEEWLQLVRDEPEAVSVPLDDDLRCAHLPQILHDLVSRLRFPIPLGTRARVSSAAAAHGMLRRKQGYAAAMLVEESRMLQSSVFQTLQDNLNKIDFSLLLGGVMAIADECDSQLAQQMAGFLSALRAGDPATDSWASTNHAQRQVA